jgi:hypothetical protein
LPQKTRRAYREISRLYSPSHESAVRGVSNLTFHDLRRTADSMERRYNIVDFDDLATAKKFMFLALGASAARLAGSGPTFRTS